MLKCLKSKRFNVTDLAIVATTIILCWVSVNLNFGKEHWKRIIQADGKGYYAYLPALFIYHDLNFGFFDNIEKDKYYDKFTFYDYRENYNDKKIDKYYFGTALTMLPFFFGAHALTFITEGECDGYSEYYPLAVNIAALFYLVLGLVFLKKLLQAYNISNRNIALILIVMVFGTNLFYYTVSEPAMSHVYSWGFTNMFLYYIYYFLHERKYPELIKAAVSLGVIILIRPVNGMIIFSIPFLAGNIENLKYSFRFLMLKPLYLFIIILIPIYIFSFQFIIYKIQTGNFIVYSYGEEGFNFLTPRFYKILFSFKKGLFVYTPALFVSLWGLINLYKNNRFAFMSLSVFLFFVTWILSSWWNWYYGGSFSSRVYIEYFAFFALLLGYALHGLKKKWAKTVYITVLSLFVILCQIQTYQYRYYIIHWCDMNWDKYWEVFLKI